MVFRPSSTPPDYAEVAGAPPYGGYDPLVASLASAVNFLAGVWLILAPFVLGYSSTGEGIDGHWNDVVIGCAIAVLALVRVIAPGNVPWFSLVNVALGVWLISAPFVLRYNDGVDAPLATANDMTVGFVVVVMATSSAVSSYRHRRRHTDVDSQKS